MPAAPRGQYLVPFVLMDCSAVLRFWLATELADLKRRQNDPAQQAVGIDRIASPVGKDRPCFRFSEACAMRLEFGGQFRNDWDRRLALAALWVRRKCLSLRDRESNVQ
jgi:hypothetical protein